MSNTTPEPRIDYEIDPASKRVRVTLTGAVLAEQVEDYLRELNQDPGFRPDFDSIIDLRGFVMTLSRTELQRIALYIRTHPANPGTRRAVLVRDHEMLATTREFENMTFLSPVIYRSFTSERAARAWLDERHRGTRREDRGGSGRE